MTKPISRFFDFPLQDHHYRIHYLEWGKTEHPLLLCAHGLTRNAHDFDYLARVICKHHRVIAIDFPGRGQSDWFEDKSCYVMPTYLEIVQILLQQLGIQSFHWLGTSMGGLIGIILASQASNKMQRLLINDVGPQIPIQAVTRIQDYLSTFECFDHKTVFEHYIRRIYAPFGQLSDEHWQHLTDHGYRINENGKLCPNYDPGIAIPFQQSPQTPNDIWDLWQMISCPVYLLHGENSDILDTSIIAKMKQLQPGLITETIKNVGHAPALMDSKQIKLIQSWLSHTNLGNNRNIR